MNTHSKAADLKKQLLSAVAMMLAAAVALGSSTYAWFVNKSRAEVKDVLFQASAGKNLEIAGAVVESGNATTLSLTEGAQIPDSKASILTYYSSVTPDILGEHSFTYPKYGGSNATTNFMTPVSADSSLIGLSDATSTFYKSSEWNGTVETGGYDKYTQVLSNNNKEYICAQMFFRASEDMDVYLNLDQWKLYSGTEDAADSESIPFITYYNPADADTNTLDAYKLQAKELSKALRIAFVEGSVNDSSVPTKSDIQVAQFTSDHLTSGNIFNTVSTDGNSLITSDTPIKTASETSTTGLYSVTAFGDAVTDVVTKYSITGASTSTNNQETDVSSNLTNSTKLFSLEANVPKRVTVYIWLEGTDQDCVSALSSYVAGVYLPFVGTVTGDDGKVSTYSLDGDGGNEISTFSAGEEETGAAGGDTYVVDEGTDEDVNQEVISEE